MNQLAPDGLIHSSLSGKTVANVHKDGHYLIIETACGHVIKIGWRTDDGQAMKGEPMIESQGVRIVLPTAGIMGIAG